MTFCVRCLLRNNPVRWISTKRKIISDFNSDVYKDITSEAIRWKRHPGIMRLNPVQVPDKIIDAVNNVTKDVSTKRFTKDGEAFYRYLMGRQPPLEEDILNEKIEKYAKHAKKMLRVNDEIATDEEIDKVNRMVDGLLKVNTYNWKPMHYDSHLSLVHLLNRAAPEYAALCRVFNELALRDESFQPQSVFDFGSGVGTVSWAVNRFWEKSVKEFYCVDVSSKMNDIAQALLQNGEFLDVPPKGVYYRQFLPSQQVQYDLVVSAYTLFELPSKKARIETLVNLWNKTKKYLVIVELGTNAGFRLVSEARDFILFGNKSDEHKLSLHKATVFAPCPHEFPCPRLSDEIPTPCNFQIKYFDMPMDNKQRMRTETFSFVILKKGERTKGDLQWPRIVKPVIKHSRQSICRFCTASGKLDEVIFSAAKHGKIPYLCARASRWGDRIPVTLTETEIVVDESQANVESDYQDWDDDDDDCNNDKIK